MSKPGSIEIPLLACTWPAQPLRRRGEPVTFGLPFPKGACDSPDQVSLERVDAATVPSQCRALDRWADGSVRWGLIDACVDAQPAVAGQYRLCVWTDRDGDDLEPPSRQRSLDVTQDGDTVTVNTGVCRFVLGGGSMFRAVAPTGFDRNSVIRPESGIVIAAGNRVRRAPFHAARIQEQGPLRSGVRLSGQLDLGRRAVLEVTALLHFFAGSPVVKVAITVRNPRRARHRRGQWPLGDPGSVLLEAIDFELHTVEPLRHIRCSPEPTAAFEECAGLLHLYQDSSGGQMWNSPVHKNRHGAIMQRFCGYQIRTGRRSGEGRRSTPIVQAAVGGGVLAIAMPRFWENCPKSLHASGSIVRLGLFPSEFADVHELQGGEQKTHECYVAFGVDSVTDEPLEWCRDPLLLGASPASYAASGAIPFLTSAIGRDTPYEALVRSAIEGPNSFGEKRERIDEYGWRHFGDLYADHEAVQHRGPAPLVSHYNNQYDAIAGFAVQFLRTGDARWWHLMDELAAHVRDIDVYHTGEDKAAYNGGLFWHTEHYTDAGTSTHRTYPAGSRGGGPSAEHNYTTGLVLHYLLTGSRESLETAIGLARWVLALDDGRQTVFRWVARGDTGLASSSGSLRYQGPGRGAANSINACVNAWQFTGESQFLEKAESLIRRCIHPRDDIEALDLLDAEKRWYYTVYLQVLASYLLVKADRGQVDDDYAYAAHSLLHYARWMTDHEYPYLDAPARLEYPTETWSAQDMRKSEVFLFAALLADPPERERFLERSWFFYAESTSRLAAASTRGFTRPVVLMLTNGWRHAFVRQPTTLPRLPVPPLRDDPLRKARFVPQKVQAFNRLRVAGAIAAFAVSVAALLVWIH